MTTQSQQNGYGLPQKGTRFVHFALDVLDLLRQSEPLGLDQDAFLTSYFRDVRHESPPGDEDTRDAWWHEFKRAVIHSCDRFNRGLSPWAWIRARPGSHRGQYFYHLLSTRDSDRVKTEANAASLTLLDDFTDRRWLTRTQSRQRVRSSHALALIDAGNQQGNQRLIDKGNELLNEFVTLSPGLASINFGTGIVMGDLQQLALSNNPRIRLLSQQIQQALRSGHRFEKDISALVNTVLALADIYRKGSMKALP